MTQFDLSYVIPIAVVAGLGGAAVLARDVLRRDTGNDRMREIAGAIQLGARAFLRRQYKTIAPIAGGLAIVFAVALGLQGGWQAGLKTAFAFGLGASFSALSGLIGMHIAIRANVRSAAGSLKSFNDALVTALRGGAGSGLSIVAMSLAGISILYYGYGYGVPPTERDQALLILSIVAFGFGASLVALFAQLGGGIYTKAADVGADLVGKVESGIPEDDPRNPAVIADLVGANVGDCAGRGADLFESTAAENIGSLILGFTIDLVTHNVAWIVFPLVVRGFGLIASVIGIFTVRGSDTKSPMSSLNLGYYITVGLSIAGMYFVTNQMLNEKGAGYWFFYAGVVGILTSLAFVFITQYYTAGDWRPVKEIAEAAKTGPATTIISGIAVGFETTAASAITISIALFLSHWFGDQWGTATGLPHGGIYGTAVATMGMLMSAAFILAEDTFGPITATAGGVASMVRASEEPRERTDRL